MDNMKIFNIGGGSGLRLLKVAGLLVFGLALGSTAFAAEDATPTQAAVKSALGVVLGGTGAGAIGEALGILNGACLALAGILAAAAMARYVAQTAFEGEALSAKGGIWAPVRFALGMAFLAPVSQGMCLAQSLAAWFLLQGAGLADDAFRAYAQAAEFKDAKAGQTAAAESAGFAKAHFEEALLRQALCLAAVKASKRQGISQAVSKSEDGMVWTVADGQCGTVDFRLSGDKGAGGWAKSLGLSQVTQEKREAFERWRADNFVPVFKAAAEAAQAVYRKAEAGREGQDPEWRALDEAFAAFAQSHELASYSLADPKALQAGLREAAGRYGWLYAGAFLMGRQWSENEHWRLGKQWPLIDPPYGSEFFREAPLDASAYKKAEAALAEFLKQRQSGALGMGARKGQSASGASQWMSERIAQSLSGPGSAPGDSFERLRNIGNRLADASEEAYFALSLAASAPPVQLASQNGLMISQNGPTPFAPNPNYEGFRMLSQLALLCVFAGSALAWLAPLMPALCMAGLAVLWLRESAALLALAPLWALGHLLSDGDKAEGRSGPGWRKAFSAWLLPAFLLAGFLLGAAAWNGVWWMALEPALGALSLAAGGGLASAMALAAGLALCGAASCAGLWICCWSGANAAREGLEWMESKAAGAVSEKAQSAIQAAGNGIALREQRAELERAKETMMGQMEQKAASLRETVVGAAFREESKASGQREGKPAAGAVQQPRESQAQKAQALLGSVQTQAAAALAAHLQSRESAGKLEGMDKDSEGYGKLMRALAAMEKKRDEQMRLAQEALDELGSLAAQLAQAAAAAPEGSPAKDEEKHAQAAFARAMEVFRRALDKISGALGRQKG